MVIKVPVYLNLDEHFHPDEVSEVTEAFRTGLTKKLLTTWKGFTIVYLGRDINGIILSTKELESLMTGTKLGQIRKTKTRLKELKSKF